MKKYIKFGVFVSIVSIVIISYLLFIKPLVGIANNGDFLRVMGAGGINFLDPSESDYDKYYGYFHSKYSFGSISLGGYFSSQLVIVAVAGLVGRIFNPHIFDIRVLSAIYSILIVIAFYIFFKYNKTTSKFCNVILASVVLIVFLDIAYVAYLNSFFGEPVSLVFMLLTLSLGFCIIRIKEPSIKLLIMFFVSALFLACSKIQNVPIGIAFSLLGIRFLVLKENINWKKSVILLSSLVLIISACAYIIAPKELKHINLYQTVFFGILKDSPDVRKDLKELGLSEKLSVLSGTNYFQKDTVIKQDDPILQQEFYKKLSHRDVAVFYMHHPLRFLEKLKQAAINSMSIRPYYLGNYEKSENKPYGELSFTYSLWSELKIKYIPNKMWFLLLFYALYYLVIVSKYVRVKERKMKIFLEMFILVGIIGIFSLVVPLIGDGEADLGKHLFLFNVCFDIMVVSGIAWVISLFKLKG